MFIHFRDLEEVIENIWIQIHTTIAKHLKEKDQELDAATETTIKNQILLLTKKESPVRQLMWKRLLAYVRLVKLNKIVPPVPPGYGDFSDELQAFASAFKRITVYNYSVFGEHYENILDRKERPKESDEATTAGEASSSTAVPGSKCSDAPPQTVKSESPSKEAASD